MRHFLYVATLLFFQCVFPQTNEQVFFTNGLKIGELTDTSMVLWTRLCKDSIPLPIYHERGKMPFRHPIDFDEHMPVDQMDGYVGGTFGEIAVQLTSEADSTDFGWEYVSSYENYTFKKEITDLQPNTAYNLVLKGRKSEGQPITQVQTTFTTAPDANSIVPVLFTTSTCQFFWSHDDGVRGYKTYDSMAKLNPLFHCQTGDYVYYDKPGPMAVTVPLARHKWSAMNSWSSLKDFYGQVPIYMLKDDHDILKDDAHSESTPFGELTFRDGLKLWYEHVPILEKPYRTKRWGKDLQIWLVEVREFRDNNSMPDSAEKTILGDEQKEWLINTMEASDATFKLIVSPTPLVGPDRPKGKNDNHSNASFQTEGIWLRNFLANQKNTFSINGDRHWQYVSKDTDSGLMEFSSGAISDEHAQGWDPENIQPEHQFLRVKGGFMSVAVQRKNEMPMITFTHYDVDGNKVNEKIIKAKP